MARWAYCEHCKKLFVGLKARSLIHRCTVSRPGQEELLTHPERGIVANDSDVVWLHPSGKLCRVTVADSETG